LAVKTLHGCLLVDAVFFFFFYLEVMAPLSSGFEYVCEENRSQADLVAY
jgi:hypothetical protein